MLEDDLRRLVVNGKQSIFENDIHWSRFDLVKAGLIDKGKRGLWALTQEGRTTHLTPEETWVLYVRVRDANRPGISTDEGEIPAPETLNDDGEDGRSYGCRRNLGGTDDQMPDLSPKGSGRMVTRTSSPMLSAA